MLFKQVIEVRSGFVSQPCGDLQNGQIGIGQQFPGVRELDTAPIRNDRGTHIVPELFLNVGVAVGDALDKLRDLLIEIVGVLHRKHQGVQPFRKIVVKLGALMQYTGTEQLHNHGFTDHQVTVGRMFTR